MKYKTKYEIPNSAHPPRYNFVTQEFRDEDLVLMMVSDKKKRRFGVQHLLVEELKL